MSNSDKNVSTKTIQIEIIDNTIPPYKEEKPEIKLSSHNPNQNTKIETILT